MKALKNSWSPARAGLDIRPWDVAFAFALVTLAGMATTSSAQLPSPKRTVIRAGRVLNVRTGELRANQAIIIEGEKIAQIAPSGEVAAAPGDAIIDGDVIGPRIVASGPALGITGGHCDENLLPPVFHFQGEGVADGVEGVQRKVREVIKYGADVIKICATGGVLSKGDDPNASQYTLEEMKAIVADAHPLGRRVAAHAHRAEGGRWASGARGGS